LSLAILLRWLRYSLTIEFVNECINNDLIAQWDCVESNPNSRKLAEKAMLFIGLKYKTLLPLRGT